MAYKAVFTEHASTDLANILSYISLDLSNLSAAKDLYGRIKESIKLISEFPYSCQTYQSTFVQTNKIRYKPINNYLLFYVVDEETKTISIIRILYSKRNIEDLFKKM